MYLNCKTYFSFKYGTFSTENLVKMAVDKGVTALALTNINSTCDIMEFIKRCRAAGIKPLAGVEIRNGDELLYILIAANNTGLKWIHDFVSEHALAKKKYPAAGSFFSDLWDGFVLYPLGRKEMADLAPNERIGILPAELPKLFSINWKPYADKLVVRQPVSFADKIHFNVHRLLRAIHYNTLLSKLPVASQASPQETFVSPAELLRVFQNYPSIITNTYKLIDACHIEFDFDTDKTKQCYGSSKEDDRILLEMLAKNGLEKRYGKKNAVAVARLEKELGIIHDLGFNAYFLINWDIIRYAQLRGFYHVGRGSGANSVVAYCLYITDVDPIELNLYFERFLNPHRTSPPDFDIDFSYTDRDEVMDYVFKRYGRDHVSLLGSYSTFQWDASLLQLGKVFGLPMEEIKILQRTRQPLDATQQLILRYAPLIIGFPNNLSVHACGMLISDKPITTYLSIYMPRKGFPTTQLDMFVAEDIGLNKFDILSQRGLGHIREALQLIKANKGIEVDLKDVKKFMLDPLVATQIREANTIGCFYIESPAMRQLLKKLRCDDYITLVAASSIIRPGVAQSGMMREYITRFHHRDQVKYLHPLFEEHLSETFGVMVFQEDVIKIAHYYGGLDLGKADILRRAMSGKYRSNNEFQLIRDEFFASSKLQGHPEALTAEIWRQMESFAGYSFNKAHSASFAVESYMSLYLKTYYPKEFMVAVINNFGGFYSRELYFMELLKTGAIINVPCINHSDLYTNIHDNEVYVGFIHIKKLQDNLIETILEERKLHGAYLHLQDFIERTNVGLEQLNTLVSIGAFRFTGKTKKELLWEANFLQPKNKTHIPVSQSLFTEEPVSFTLPVFRDEPLDDLYDQFEIMGFTVTNPFAMVNANPADYTPAKDMGLHAGKIITVLCYFIARKHVRTVSNEEMFFGTFVDANLDWVDTVHFPESAKNNPLHTAGFYAITGKVTADFGVYSLEVHGLKRTGYKPSSYADL